MAAPAKLYELCGADPQRVFSPFCWAVRLALLHKKRDVTTIPWKFTDKEAIAFSGQGKVPVLVDGEKVVIDSFEIAKYIEETYPDGPTLFGGPSGLAGVVFAKEYIMGSVLPAIFPLIVADICSVLAPDDADYFRSTREAALGKKLEEICPESAKEAQITKVREALQIFRSMLGSQPFFGGESPLYSDILLVSVFLLVKSVSSVKLLESDDPVYAWRERMLSRFQLDNTFCSEE